MYRISDRVSVWGSVSGGFRAPTLNELYRQFRVGALLVLANNQLGPENLVGGEAGVNLIATENVTVRGTWYINGIENPVSNVTIGHEHPAAAEPWPDQGAGIPDRRSSTAWARAGASRARICSTMRR